MENILMRYCSSIVILFWRLCVGSSFALASHILLVFLSVIVSDVNAENVTAKGRLKSEQVRDMIVAAVDGEPVTLSDLRLYGGAKGEDPGELPMQFNAKAKALLKDFILDRLIEKEAQSVGISVSEEEVGAYLKEIKLRNALKDHDLEDLLQNTGLNSDQYRSQIRSEILRVRVIASMVKAKVQVTDEDIRRFIAEHPERLPREGSLYLREIVLKYPTDVSSDIRDAYSRQLLGMKARIEKGESWEKVGGDRYRDIGYVYPGDLQDNLREALHNLKLGEVSSVQQVEEGLALISFSSVVNDQDNPGYVFMNTLRDELYKSRFNERLEQYLGKELPGKYHVELLY